MDRIKSILPWIVKIKWPLIAVVTMVFLSFIGYLFIIFGGRFVVDEKNLILPSTTTVVTQDGTTVAKLYEENRELVTIDEIPDHVEEAFLAIEDQRFYDHAGVDFTSVARAVYRDILARSKVEGGSTITQQLAKNLFLYNDKTWMRKTKEVMASIYLERNLSKKKILELYLNEIYFAHGVYGVGTAAEFYFNKQVDELSIEEGAMLAALSKAPNTYSPLNNPDKAKERRNLVLHQMHDQGQLETEQMLQLQGKTLGINQPETKDRPWIDDYLDVVVKEMEDQYNLTLAELRRGGYQIVVHLNEEAQQIAYQAFQQDSYFPGSTDGVEGSFVLLNQDSGQIEVLLGGRNFEAGGLNRALVPRQPGSTIKPLAVYGPALMKSDDYQAYAMLPDQPIDYDGYTVANADGQYNENVTLYDAIKWSKNAPAVWLLNQIGIDYSKSFLDKMEMPIQDNGLAIALGGLKKGLTPVQIAAGYRTFLHNGEWTGAHTIDRIFDRNGDLVGEAEPETREVFSPQVAWNMVRMLESVVNHGTATSGEYTQSLAGKTGSTQHPHVSGSVKDAWFVGMTPEYVTTLWMGYDSSSEDHYLTKGSQAPTVLTKDILQSLNKQQGLAAEFAKPDNVEDLPEPIELPKINDLKAEMKLGGTSIVSGELTWTTASEERIVYRIYQETDEGEQQIAEVKGNSYTIDRINIFSETTYYIIPYDPVTKQSGEPSNKAELTFGFRFRR